MAKEKAKGGPQPAQRLPGAEDACISQEQLEIVEWYENAIRAERARYNALLEAHTPPGENHEEGC